MLAVGVHLDFFLVMCLVCPQLKLEDYKRRLAGGEGLNKDQMVTHKGNVTVCPHERHKFNVSVFLSH